MGNILQQFQAWMARSGNYKFVEWTMVPGEPLSPRTCRNRLLKIRPILRDLGYLIHIENPQPHKPDQWLINPRRRIEALKAREVERWFQTRFPPGDRTPKQKGQWDDFAGALRTFTDFMHYHKKVWSKDKRAAMRARIRLYNLALYSEIDIVDPRKALAFQRWLERQPRYYPHAIMLHLMQWLGMRYLEVARSRASLQGPTLKVEWDGGWVRVWGKGRGGLSKLRSLPLTGETGSKLEDYLGWRRAHGITSPWLFVTHWGRPWSESSWGYNKTIRERCLPHYNEWLRKRRRPELILSDGEIRKMTTHRMGRHVFGTVYAPHLPPKAMMEFMGIVKYEIVNRYVNFERAEKVGQFMDATAAVLATRCSRRRQSHGSPVGRDMGGGGPGNLPERVKMLNRGHLRYRLSLADASEGRRTPYSALD